MHINFFSSILAQAAAPQQSPFGIAVPMVLMLVILYFMMIRPQQQRAKQQSKLLEALKPGDKVGTASGIIATVISVKDKSVTLRSADSKFEVTKASVTEILETGAASESPKS